MSFNALNNLLVCKETVNVWRQMTGSYRALVCVLWVIRFLLNQHDIMACLGLPLATTLWSQTRHVNTSSRRSTTTEFRGRAQELLFVLVWAHKFMFASNFQFLLSRCTVHHISSHSLASFRRYIYKHVLSVVQTSIQDIQKHTSPSRMSRPPCRLSMKFARMDYHDYINRVGNQELVSLLIGIEQQMGSQGENSPVASDGASSRPFFSSETTPMRSSSHVAGDGDSTESEDPSAVLPVSKVPEEPVTSLPPSDAEGEMSQGSDVSMGSPPSARAVSVVSRRSKNPSTSSRSSHTHKWLGTHRRTSESSSPPQSPLLTVDPINAATTSQSSKGKSRATSPPPRSHQALKSLKGILQNSKIPRIFSRSELKAPDNEPPTHKRRKTLFSPSPRVNSPDG